MGLVIMKVIINQTMHVVHYGLLQFDIIGLATKVLLF